MLDIDIKALKTRLLYNLSNTIGHKKKIVVAMSGGVDSSVVAALLTEAGHDVLGITLQLYDHGIALSKKGACCAGIDIYDAQMAAEKVGIPHYVFNYQNNFKKEVIDEFIEGYARGETPVPCILCNQKIKFKDLLKASQDLQADYMATGHYVQKKTIVGENSQLHMGLDPLKDQSYFLFTTTQHELENLLFPLGSLYKAQTRALALSYKLAVSDKSDSQDICFVPDGDYRQIIRKEKPELDKGGDIISMEGKVIGKHKGIINYTVGQRKGIGIQSTSPLYVINIDAANNRIVVGEKDNLVTRNVNLVGTNWLFDTKYDEFECKVKLRSAHSGSEALVKKLSDNKAQLTLYQDYFAVAPGQACVMYTDTMVLGGGWITSLEV